jgi:hypothetical protein
MSLFNIQYLHRKKDLFWRLFYNSLYLALLCGKGISEMGGIALLLLSVKVTNGSFFYKRYAGIKIHFLISGVSSWFFHDGI